MRFHHLLPLVALSACARAGSSADACALAEAGPGWLAFASQRTGDFEIWVARADGGCQQRLTDAPSSMELHPSWSRHGTIAFTSDRSGALRIWVHDLATGAETELDTGDVRASSPAFSPDGASIAFEGRPPGAATADVYVVAAAGGPPVALTSDAADDAGPAWSPDGQTVYFVSSRSGRYEVWSVPAAGGTATQLTTGSRILGRPAVGPGGRLYFARAKEGSSDTEVVRLLLSEAAPFPIEVLSSPGDSEPAVSAAGDRVAMRTFRYGAANAEIVAVDEGDGGNAARLTDDPASDGAPCFAPGP